MSDKFKKFETWGQFHLGADTFMLNCYCQEMDKNILSPEPVLLKKDNVCMPIQSSVITYLRNVRLFYVNVCFFWETLAIKVRMIDEKSVKSRPSLADS